MSGGRKSPTARAAPRTHRTPAASRWRTSVPWPDASMQAMTKLVALGVAVLPPPDVMARAIACSAALPRDGSERLVLDAAHLPHLTLTQHVIRYEELDGAYAEIDEVLEGQVPLRL